MQRIQLGFDVDDRKGKNSSEGLTGTCLAKAQFTRESLKVRSKLLSLISGKLMLKKLQL